MIETFDYGITREWLDGGALVVIRTQGDMRRAAIDAWAQVVQSTIDVQRERDVLAVLHDLSHPSQGFTTYSRQRALDTLAMIPKNKSAYTALVLRDKLETQLIKIFLSTLGKLLSKHQIRVFYALDDGIAWLRARYAAHAAPSHSP